MNINIIRLVSTIVCLVAVEVHSAASDVSKVLATIDGKSLITEQQFTQAFDRILDENPRLKEMLPMIPKDQFLGGMVSQEIVDKFIVDNKLDQSQSYKKEFDEAIGSIKADEKIGAQERAQAMLSIRSALNTKYFTEQFPVTITDAEAQKFYDENKQNIPELLISADGVKVSGISLETEAEAKQIAKDVQGKSLERYATTAGKKSNFRDFGLVTAKSTSIDRGLKAKIMALKKFPAVEVLKATDGTLWVVSATGAQEAQYQPFEKIKNELKNYLENKNRGDKLSSEIERLQKEYKIVIVQDEPEAKKVATRVKKAGPRLAGSSKTLKNTKKSTKIA